VRNLRLGTLAAHFRSPVTPNHRALADAEATAHVLFRLLEQSGSLGTTHLDDLLLLCSAKGSAHYDKISLTEDLPRRPGVYLFRNKDGEVIYVGKAKNLRSRVRQYFHGDTRRTIAAMLRDLESIEYRVCPTELEAEVTELRLIGAHRPRYNRRGRPTKSTFWIKLTPEKFPRLSIARTLKDDGGHYLGPFKRRKHAQEIVLALWDATQIRRCTGPAGKRKAKCAPAQLGKALCPCDGELTEDEYRPVVKLIVDGLNGAPEGLLTPLAEKVTDCVSQQRYEDAARLRDRYDGLRRCLVDRSRWQVMQQAGSVVVELVDGSGFCLVGGRLAGSWGAGELPLRQIETVKPETAAISTQVPVSPEAAAEARLIWKWLARGDSRPDQVLDSSAPPELAEAVGF
jgi:DNA polymerase-3 subunit epsilon